MKYTYIHNLDKDKFQAFDFFFFMLNSTETNIIDVTWMSASNDGNNTSQILVISNLLSFQLWHKAVWMGHPLRLRIHSSKFLV